MKAHLGMAAMILLAFFALWRTGEALSVCGKNLILNQSNGIVRLPCTKMGHRGNAGATVAFNPSTLDVLAELV